MYDRTAIKQEKKKTLLLKSNDDIRQDYVQHLLANVPKDTKSKYEIIEKTTVAPPSTTPTNDSGIYDSIEGYRIEIKKDGKSPSTIILKKKKEEEIKKEQEAKKKKEEEKMAEENLEDDPDALFETMMMLKEMNMDKDQTISPATTKSEPTVEKKTEEKKAEENKPVIEKKAEEKKPVVEKKPVEKKVTIVENKIEVPPASARKEEKRPATKKGNTAEGSSAKTKEDDTNIIKVSSQKVKKPIKKKKSTVPELSLFGTIWTILDHLTTKATRAYLNELQNNHRRIDVALLLDNELMDDSNYLRGQILSERILDT